ncbi:DUF5403 family protein [Nocardia sp. NPDC001965]
MAVKLIGDKAMNRVVSHHSKVQAAITEETEEATRRGEARLAAHRETGNAEVNSSYGETDGYVNLDDQAAMSIEFGHFVGGKYETDEPKFVPGLYIISEATGLLS